MARRVKCDAISIVEAAYDLESDDRTWLTRLLESAEGRLNRGFGVTVSTYAPGTPPDESLVTTRNMDTRVYDAMMTWSRTFSEDFRVMNTPGPNGCVTASQRLGMARMEALASPTLTRVNVHDFFGVGALDPDGHAIWLGAPMAVAMGHPSRQESAMWSRVAVHLSAGARLRRALRGLRALGATPKSDAVLSLSGAVEHAEPCAQARGVREQLRTAALSIMKARSAARLNDDEALDLWKGLVAGRWSLVEHFERDGRRYLFVHKNEPAVRDPRRLTLRERQVLAYTASGDSLKLTAYALGLSVTSIHRHREAAMRKLGLRSLADVVRLFSGPPSG
jgi:DNA-binding CsgD family transcriptional regulator